MRQTRPSHTTRASSLQQRTRFRRYKQYDFSKVSSGFSLHSGRASAYCTKPWTAVSTVLAEQHATHSAERERHARFAH